MLRFILIVIGLYLIVSKPALILLGGAAILVWLYLKKPNSFSKATQEEESKEPEPDLSREERADQEAEKKMKPGFREDPRWQELSKKVRDHIQKAREIEEEELRKLGQNVKNWL